MMAEPLHRQPDQPKFSNRAPTAFQFQPSSPLETLVRRTSSKRYNQSLAASRSTPGSSPNNSNSNLTLDSSYNSSPNSTPNSKPSYGQRYPNSYAQSQQPVPPSPLLHGHFRAASSATGISADDSSFVDNSFIEMDFDPREALNRDSIDSRHSNLVKLYTRQEEERYQYYDADSVYSTDTALRDSWQSTSRGARISHSPNANQVLATASKDPFAISDAPPTPTTPETPISPVPTVVVTAAEYDDAAPRSAGKAPILRPAGSVSNFSRPVRAVSDAPDDPDTTDSRSNSVNYSRSSGRPKSSAAPVLEASVLNYDSKQKVLQRNASRRQNGMSPSPSTSSFSPSGNRSTFARTPSPLSPETPDSQLRNQSGYFGHNGSPVSNGSTSPLSPGQSMLRHNFAGAAESLGLGRPPSTPGESSYSHGNYSSSGSPSRSLPPSASLSPSTSRSVSPSPSPLSSRSRSPYNAHPPVPINTSAGLSTPSSASQFSQSNEVLLPRRPPSLHAESPTSLYSDNYSFYQLDSASPNGSGNFKLDSPAGSRSGSKSPLSRSAEDPTPEVQSKAQEYLQLGITHHEANRLQESAVCFEKSAKVDGGCGVGMLMWGLTLRHGWGCTKDEKGGFKWLRKAAEGAVTDLENARMSGGVGKDSNGAVKAELVLAIYEVGQCFFHGWGVPKDQKMAVSYYRVAARLGDADAQNDLGFCLANGKGCKKDRKEAAKWYRAAVAQGQSDIGLAWIYKEKFQ